MIVRQGLLEEDDMRTSSMPKMLAGEAIAVHIYIASQPAIMYVDK